MNIKRYNIWAISIIITMLLTTHLQAYRIPYDPASMSYPISVEVAYQIVRNWAGDQTLAITIESVLLPDENSQTAKPHYYIIKSIDGVQEFWVDCVTGNLHHWENIPVSQAYVQKIGDHWDETTQLPVSDLNNSIQQFVSSKYANFSSLNMQHYYPDEPTSAYVQKLPNGVWYTGNMVRCGIDRWTGTVIEYYATHSSPPAIPIDPNLTVSQAEVIASQHAWTLLVDSYDEASGASVKVHPQSMFTPRTAGPILIVDFIGAQRLQWSITLVLSADQNYSASQYNNELTTGIGIPTGNQVTISVDAHTGDVCRVNWSGYQGGNGKALPKSVVTKKANKRTDNMQLKQLRTFKKAEITINGLSYKSLCFPPLIDNNTAYFYSRYLPLLLGGSVTWSKGSAIIRIGNKTTTVKANSEVFTVDGKSLHNRPIKLINNRIYLSPEAVELLCGGKCVYDAKKNILQITTKNLSATTSARQGLMRKQVSKQQ